ncbi:MAG: hypothetical protein JWM81_1088 [Candidatus Saccharibacteria bacterium]|nr:hypothetical protein [Candidatus Saccharibacteria bacterium]
MRYNKIMILQNIAEKVKRHPRISTGIAVFLGLAAVAEIDGYASNRTYDRPDHSCVSPFSVSDSYRDSGTNTLLMTDTGILTTGISAKVHLRGDAYGLQAAYEDPAENGSGWHISRMVKANKVGDATVKLAIGSGEVHFGVRAVAPQGSATCEAAPDTTFSHLGKSDYYGNDGKLAWTNPVNTITSVVHS